MRNMVPTSKTHHGLEVLNRDESIGENFSFGSN